MKSNIALVTGGYSGEAVISYKTAITILQHIDTLKYNIYKIDITPNGWYYEASGNTQLVDKNDFSIQINSKKIVFDAVLIGIHGTPGEDGKLQGYFDMLNIPYTSCNAATSALTFNKRYTVAVAAFAGIQVAQSVHLFKKHPLTAQQVLQQVQLPVFVKPNNGGSSIGMSKVTQTNDLQAAIDKAFKEDNQVLVEEYISGREFTVGVFKTKGVIKVLPITEIIPKNDFFDYEAKYTTGMANEVTPAQIDASVTAVIQSAAQKVYEVFNCSGIVRIDFIYNDKSNQPFLLEINTVPGQSEASIVPQQVKAMGWTLTDFYSTLIEEAMH
ncbi:MAG TPA: D-alanine--D-alanine ligase [Chitinophagaceae bacterium]|nr:D-alanine--D-alanine ligase [Chitinophagaceae bacterium]